jgi:hypothetical protein
MSGGPSVPLAILALFVESDAAKIGLWITAAVCVVLSAYFVWRPERLKVIDLTEQIRPKLKCAFRRQDTGCVRPDTGFTTTQQTVDRQVFHSAVKCTYYRVKVEADHIGSVSSCCGRLVSIKRNGEDVLSGEHLFLTFAPAERSDTIAKIIHNGVPEYLDFLAITERNHVLLTTHGFAYPSSVKMHELFSKSGEYVFEIVVTSPEAVPVTVEPKPKLKWTGDWQTAEVM